MATEKKTTKKPVAKKAAPKKAVKKEAEVKEEIKEVKIEAKVEDLNAFIPSIIDDDDDFVVNEDDFKDLEDKYFVGTGRRKTAIARVRLYTKGDKTIEVNGMEFTKYFPTKILQLNALASLDKMKSMDRFKITVTVKGGGVNSQAEAMRHGIARALVVFNADYRKRLRKAGFLTRDPRMKERKKPGLKRARRAPQWSKR
ncbi:MAG: 30S ribosomal protein S9 [Minisyncoccales bacterium]